MSSYNATRLVWFCFVRFSTRLWLNVVEDVLPAAHHWIQFSCETHRNDGLSILFRFLIFNKLTTSIFFLHFWCLKASDCVRKPCAIWWIDTQWTETLSTINIYMFFFFFRFVYNLITLWRCVIAWFHFVDDYFGSTLIGHAWYQCCSVCISDEIHFWFITQVTISLPISTEHLFINLIVSHCYFEFSFFHFRFCF